MLWNFREKASTSSEISEKKQQQALKIKKENDMKFRATSSEDKKGWNFGHQQALKIKKKILWNSKEKASTSSEISEKRHQALKLEKKNALKF